MISLANRTIERGKNKRKQKKELAKCQKRMEEKDFRENGCIPLEGSGTLSRTGGAVGSVRSSASLNESGWGGPNEGTPINQISSQDNLGALRDEGDESQPKTLWEAVSWLPFNMYKILTHLYLA